MHPNVVLYYESFLEKTVRNLENTGGELLETAIETTSSGDGHQEECLCIVMEYCNGGSLHDILRVIRRIKRTQEEEVSSNVNTETTSSFHIPENVLWKWFIQMVWALKYVHHKRIVHRDVKPMNLLLSTLTLEQQDVNHQSAAASIDGPLNRDRQLLHSLYKCDLKLADFGVSRLLESSNAMAQTLVGTPLYLPPELVEGKPYDSKVDIWAIGCCWYELMMHRHPFEATNQAALVMKILEGKFASIPTQNYSEEFIQLIYSCLQKDAKQRYSCAELLELDVVKKKAHELGLVLDASYENFEIDVTNVHAASSQRDCAGGRSPSEEEIYPREARYRLEEPQPQRNIEHKSKRVVKRSKSRGGGASQNHSDGRVPHSSTSYSHCIPPRPVATRKLNFNKIGRIRRPASSQRSAAVSSVNGANSAKRKGLSLRANKRSPVLRRKEVQQVRNLPDDLHEEVVGDGQNEVSQSHHHNNSSPSSVAPSRGNGVVERYVKQPELVKILSSQSMSIGSESNTSAEPEDEALHVEISLHDESSVVLDDETTREVVHDKDLSASVTWKVIDEDAHKQIDHDHLLNSSTAFAGHLHERLQHVLALEQKIRLEIGDEIMQEFIHYFTEHPNLSEERIVQFAFGKISYGQASVVPLCRELVEERTEDILEYRIQEMEDEIMSKISEQHYREILSFFMQKHQPTQEDIHRFVFGRIGYDHLDLVHVIRQVAIMRREIEMKRVIEKD